MDTASSDNQLVFIQGRDAIDVHLHGQTLWLTQLQMATLFGTTPENVLMHLKNVFADGELDAAATAKDFLAVRREGHRQVKRRLKHYNLDAIISVGYRVSSVRATQFRIWATGVLRQHLTDGITLNQRRLLERGVALEEVLALLSQTLVNQQLVSKEGEEILRVIRDYARTWHLLQRYDEQALPPHTLTQPDMRPLPVDAALAAIAQLKAQLQAKGQASALFGQLRGPLHSQLRDEPHGDGLAACLAGIEQSFGDTLLYPNIASRAAHLLYFVVKNHPLVDGNKRCGAFLFLCYLRLNQHLLAKPVAQLINDNTLVALTLLLAESAPRQKDLMVGLVAHLLAESAIAPKPAP